MNLDIFFAEAATFTQENLYQLLADLVSVRPLVIFTGKLLLHLRKGLKMKTNILYQKMIFILR